MTNIIEKNSGLLLSLNPELEKKKYDLKQKISYLEEQLSSLIESPKTNGSKNLFEHYVNEGTYSKGILSEDGMPLLYDQKNETLIFPFSEEHCSERYSLADEALFRALNALGTSYVPSLKKSSPFVLSGISKGDVLGLSRLEEFHFNLYDTSGNFIAPYGIVNPSNILNLDFPSYSAREYFDIHRISKCTSLGMGNLFDKKPNFNSKTFTFSPEFLDSLGDPFREGYAEGKIYSIPNRFMPYLIGFTDDVSSINWYKPTLNKFTLGDTRGKMTDVSAHNLAILSSIGSAYRGLEQTFMGAFFPRDFSELNEVFDQNKVVSLNYGSVKTGIYRFTVFNPSYSGNKF